MILSPFLALGMAVAPALAQTAGTFEQVGDTLVSAMMVRILRIIVASAIVASSVDLTIPPIIELQMFLGNEGKVYILDKSEGNAAQINGHPAWASVWCVLSLKALLPLDPRLNALSLVF